ncbi:MAG: thioredoxin family protein [Oceanospirillales bacterium]|uniref:Small redox-active disulfide protein 2 n=1 Tax=Marinobacterium halophilum TaxID=267374 RepID=A0A2P8F4W8_9GAMM|nr:thioredoxin family protein [Marinobacterium halophilum]MBR9829421.1 thioredoxin family protein [Oceanospirillales bacterium]PSL16750.1 small redox-active disulfide protein 2 [Marinobacterium halophilum]
MKLTIYGSGCAKCRQLTANAEAAAHALGLEYDVEKVTDVNTIIADGVMHTPALAVDGTIIIEGKVAAAEEIEALIT